MGLLTEILDTITGGLFSGAVGYNQAMMAKEADTQFGGLTQAEQEQNRYNMFEAEKAREFNAAEADKARAWQEEFYNKYQSPSAQIAQYREAGINPAVMFGQGPSSPSPASSPAASSPAASSSGGAGFAQLLQWMVGVKNAVTQSKLASAQTKKAEADAKKTDAETGNILIEGESLNERLLATLENTKSDTDLKRAQELVSVAQENKTFKEIEAIGVDMKLDEMSISQKQAEILLTQSKTLSQDIQNAIDYMSADEKVKYAKIYNDLLSAKTSKEIAESGKILVEKAAELYELQYMEHFNAKIAPAYKYFGFAQSLAGLANQTASELSEPLSDLKQKLLSLWSRVKDYSVPYRKDIGID